MHDTTGVVVVSTLLEYIHRLCCQLCIRRTVHTDRTAQRWAALGPEAARRLLGLEMLSRRGKEVRPYIYFMLRKKVHPPPLTIA